MNNRSFKMKAVKFIFTIIKKSEKGLKTILLYLPMDFFEVELLSEKVEQIEAIFLLIIKQITV